MNKKEVAKVLKESRLLPLVTIHDINTAKPLAETLRKSNMNIVEVAFRSDLAAQAIREMSAVTGMVIGAGTILNVQQAKAAIENGAKFLVTPGISEEVLKYAADNDIPLFPGVVTPSEIIKAKQYGNTIMKFFPAADFGGLKTLKSFHGPFKDCEFLPTGGIHLSNYKEYLSLDYVIAVGGSFVVPDSFITQRDWSGLQKYILDL